MTQAELESCALSQGAAQQDETTAEAMSRRLAALQSEIRRYQTRLFAYERAMLALRHENEQLEERCEELRARLSEWMDVPSPTNETVPVLENIPDDAFRDAETLVRPPEPAVESDETSASEVPAEAEPPVPVQKPEAAPAPAETAPVEPDEAPVETDQPIPVSEEGPVPMEALLEAEFSQAQESEIPQTDLERRAAALLAQFDQIQKSGL